MVDGIDLWHYLELWYFSIPMPTTYVPMPEYQQASVVSNVDEDIAANNL